MVAIQAEAVGLLLGSGGEPPPVSVGDVLLWIVLLALPAVLWSYAVWRRTRARRAAEGRALALAQASLDAVEWRQLTCCGYLEVASRLVPGRCYRIPAQPGRVTVHQDGQKVGELCLVELDVVPYLDMVLTQKWLIEADERAYLSTANSVDPILETRQVPSDAAWPACHRVCIWNRR